MGGSLLHGGTRDREESSPFFHNRESDTVNLLQCRVCAAPVKVYEVKEHERACFKIESLRPSPEDQVGEEAPA